MTSNNNASPRNRTNVVPQRRSPVNDSVRAFNTLTHQLVMERYRAGTLPEGVIQALLVGVGLDP
jgi:hypothetical protein